MKIGTTRSRSHAKSHLGGSSRRDRAPSILRRFFAKGFARHARRGCDFAPQQDVESASSEHIELLDGGEQAYPRMLQAIANARSYVHLEVYSFAPNGIGARFIAELSDAARRGVSVHVLMDGWGSALGGRAVSSELRAAGCDVNIYHRLFTLFRGRFGRNHRKLLLVDDDVAFIGGINIGDENLRDGIRPGWADLTLELRGPQCRRIGQLVRGESVTVPERAVHVAFSGLGGGHRLRRLYLRAFARARERIYIAHGYFLPDRRVLRSIMAAARRGVEVSLLLAGQSDVPLARAATRRLYRRLLTAGVKIHEWDGSVLHAKVACVDGRCLLIGSFNLDPFSLANREVLVQVTEPRVVADGILWIETRLRSSPAITPIEVRTWIRVWVLEPLGAFIATLAVLLGRMLTTRRTRQWLESESPDGASHLPSRHEPGPE